MELEKDSELNFTITSTETVNSTYNKTYHKKIYLQLKKTEKL